MDITFENAVNEKMNNHPSLKQFFESKLFMALLMATTVLFWYFDLKIQCLLFAVIMLFMVVITKAKLYTLPEILGMVYCGNQGLSDLLGYTNGNIPTHILVTIIAIAVFGIGSLIVFLIRNRKNIIPCMKKLMKNWVFIGLLILSASMLISVTQSKYTFQSLAYCLGFMVNWALMILLVIDGAYEKEYRRKLLIGMLFFFTAVMIEMGLDTLILFMNGELGEALKWKKIDLGWSVSNHYIVLVVMGIALNLYFIYEKICQKQFKSMLINILLFICGLGCVVLSLCRSAMLAMACMAVFYYLYFVIHYKKARKILLVILILGVAAFAGLCVLLYYRGYFAIWENTVEGQGFLTDRDELWLLAWNDFLDHPILGSGMESSVHIIAEYGRDEYNYHNCFMQISQCGIVGIFAFSFYLMAIVRYLKGKNNYNIFMIGLSIYFFVHGLFDTLFFNQILNPYFNIFVLMLIFSEGKEPAVQDSPAEE